MQIPTLEGGIPYLNTAQMIEVDRAMTEDYRIELIQMIENAGRCLAFLARERFLGGAPTGKRVTVMAGGGGNGGGALVAARRLHNWGAKTQVLLARDAAQMTTVAGHQLEIVKRMGVDCVAETGLLSPGDVPDVIIDGLIGYSLKGAPYGRIREFIEWSNASSAPILALDTPLGIDTSTGTVFDPSIEASATMTLALPKEGLRAPGVDTHVGELYLADISVPPALYNESPLGLEVGPIFATADVIRLPPGMHTVR